MTSLTELAVKFKTRKQCLKFLKSLRFPNGLYCPRCASIKVCTIKTVNKFQCLEPECKYMFSVTAGTIFHRSHIPLQKWIIACFLICNAKKGISAKQIQRDLRVTYKTAWYMMHRIRRAMKDSDYLRKLSGIVEMDETYVGGKVRKGGTLKGRRLYNKVIGRYQPKKSIVIGAVERGGQVSASVIPNVQKQTISEFVKDNISPETEMLITDEFNSYTHLRLEFNLKRIHHQYEYVRGEIHTNTIENFWSILKRGHFGVYHKMSAKYLPLYLSEFTYRYNHNGTTELYKKVIKNGLLTDSGLVG